MHVHEEACRDDDVLLSKGMGASTQVRRRIACESNGICAVFSTSSTLGGFVLVH